MDDVKFFRKGTIQICGSLDIDEALKGLYYFLKEHMPLELIEIGIVDPEKGVMVFLSWYTELKLDKASHDPIVLPAESIDMVRNKRMLIPEISYINEDPFTRKVMASRGLSDVGGFSMALRINKESLGRVAVMTRRPRQLTSEHIRLLRLLRAPLAVAVSNHLRYREVVRLKELLTDDNQYLRRELDQIAGKEIIGEDFGLRDVMKLVNQVAPLDSNVLLLGETGVGKEIIANALHYRSARRKAPLIKVNCGAIPEGLLDSELFGHEKGAFTGASSERRGRFERAHGGTIFLDEVGELPLAAQVRFLRVLQDREIERVGGTKPVPIDVRVIAATNRDLGLMVREGKFREDLWYRLNVIPVHIPPLRRRVEDIPALVNHFIDKKSKEMNIPCRPALAPDALTRLQAYSWPGNVRELENVVERELIQSQATSTGEPLRFRDIVARVPAIDSPSSFREKTEEKACELDDVMRSHILQVLEQANGRVQGSRGAASLLGVNPSTLRHRMRKLGIPFGRKNR